MMHVGILSNTHLPAAARALLAVAMITLMGLVAWADVLAGHEWSLGVFYVLPVFALAWWVSSAVGLAGAALTGVLLYVADRYTGSTDAHSFAYYWDVSASTLMFVLIALLVIELRRRFRLERRLALTDYRTGTLSARGIEERLRAELERSSRLGHGFTLVLLDVAGPESGKGALGGLGIESVRRHVARRLRQALRQFDALGCLDDGHLALVLPGVGMDEAVEWLKSCMNEAWLGSGRPCVHASVVNFTDDAAELSAAMTSARELLKAAKMAGANHAVCGRWTSTGVSTEDARQLTPTRGNVGQTRKHFPDLPS